MNINAAIAKTMKTLGMPAGLKGYDYAKEAIRMVVEDPGAIHYMTKGIYPGVAKKFVTTPSRVERGIRHAIEVAWDRGDPDMLMDYFGFTVSFEKGKPTNREFIATIAERLSMECGEQEEEE